MIIFKQRFGHPTNQWQNIERDKMLFIQISSLSLTYNLLRGDAARRNDILREGDEWRGRGIEGRVGCDRFQKKQNISLYCQQKTPVLHVIKINVLNSYL